MRINPVPRRRAFTDPSDLRPIVLRMIGSNSLAAFAEAIGRPAQLPPARARAPGPDGIQPVTAPAPAQRQLEAVPPRPAAALPRGSLLDLRV